MKSVPSPDIWTLMDQPAERVAPHLLGCLLTRQLPTGEKLVGKIVETEAYDQHDAASHSYKGRTPRTDVMFGPPGYLYVYFTYGMHYCCNIVTGGNGHGAAVLIRALEPVEEIESMVRNRAGRNGIEVSNGPAKLCQAFGIDKAWNGHDLRQQPLTLTTGKAIPATEIVQTTRIGISQAQDIPWRFYIRDNPFVSKI